VSFDIEHADLNYQKGWPLIRKLDGEVVFENASLHARIDSGRIFGSSIRSGGKVDINSFYRARLDVDAAAKARLEDVLRYVKESPLGKGMEDFLAQVKSSGRTNLDLNLRIPLSNKIKKPMQVKGKLGMSNARMALPKHNVDFRQIKGQLNFTKDKYSAEDIKATFRGKPVTAGIQTRKEGQIEVDVAGDFSATELLPDARPILDKLLQGQSSWLAKVGIPPRKARAGGESIWIDVSSTLEGIGVNLPAPLGKKASWPRKFSVRYHFLPNFPGLEVTYGNSLQVLAELEKGPGFNIHRGVIGLSRDHYQLPEEGIEVRGHWPSMRVSGWNDVIKRFSGSAGQRSAGILAGLKRTDISFGSLDIGGRKFDDIQIQSTNAEEDWRIHLDSPALAGDIRFPHTWHEGTPLEARLNRLHLPLAVEGHKSTPISPLLLPAIRLEIDDFRREGVRYKKFLLSSSSNLYGQTIDLFKLDAEDFSMQASGTWIEKDNVQRTGLDIQFSSKNLGSSLVALGYGDNLVHGKGEATGNLSWTGAAYQYDIASLNASLEFKFESGMLRKVDPGLGRLLSLLSVDYIPRRLKLDFKDIAEKGFHYDILHGTAKIVKGTVYTSGVLIDGPSAAFALAGQTGLIEHNYDMRLELVPKFKSTVPLAAGVIAGPQTGLLVYLFDRIAQEIGVDFNRTVTLNYDISGTWEKPVITSLQSLAEDNKESVMDDY
jgi:uncharacterized protein (TIGR02099 family)